MIHDGKKFTDLSAEIKIELVKFTNLIRKKCNFCSSIQKHSSLFIFEKDSISYFVCPNCIIKLALNELYSQKITIDKRKNNLLISEFKSLTNYLNIIIKEIEKKK